MPIFILVPLFLIGVEVLVERQTPEDLAPCRVGQECRPTEPQYQVDRFKDTAQFAHFEF